MGLLGLFRKKEEKPGPELPPADVKLSGLSSWLGQELSEKAGSARKKSGELQDRIVKGFGQVADSAKKLGRAEFEVKDKTYAAVNSVKDSFAKRAQSLSAKCPGQVPESYSGMREFHKRAGSLLKEIMNINPRQGMILSSYFKKDSSSVMGSVKGINSALEELEKFLDYEGKPLFILEEAERISGEISGKLESLGSLDKRGREIQEETRGMKETLSGREGNLDEISRNAKWKALEGAKKEREALEARARDLKFRIGEELSHAKRPLKKYLHLRAGELSREERELLERFVKSPLKAVMRGGGLEQVRSTLLDMRGMLGSEISLKEKEIQKLEGLIKGMESGEIASSIREYEGLLRESGEKGGEIEREFSGLSEEKRQAESGVKEVKEQILKLENEFRETRERAGGLKEEIDKSRKELEDLIYENINRRVNIILDNGAIG